MNVEVPPSCVSVIYDFVDCMVILKLRSVPDSVFGIQSEPQAIKAFETMS